MAIITQHIGTVRTLADAPNPLTDAQEVFDQKGYAYTQSQKEVNEDIQARITELNTFAGQVNDVRDEIIEAKDAVLTNYKGVWNSITTYAVGESVSSGGFYWISNVNSNLNKTPVEGVNWSKIGTVGGNYLPLSGGTMTGAITSLKETSVAMPANNINLATGNLFTKTITGATTLTVSNVPASGTVGYFILQLTNGGSATVTWFSGVKWAGGVAPTLTASGVDVLSFYTIDAGTTWKVVSIQKDIK